MRVAIRIALAFACRQFSLSCGPTVGRTLPLLTYSVVDAVPEFREAYAAVAQGGLFDQLRAVIGLTERTVLRNAFVRPPAAPVL